MNTTQTSTSSKASLRKTYARTEEHVTETQPNEKMSATTETTRPKERTMPESEPKTREALKIAAAKALMGTARENVQSRFESKAEEKRGPQQTMLFD